MSSKRLRALRNRQDRTQFKNQLKEVNEPFMDNENVDKVETESQTDSKQEPQLDIAATVKEEVNKEQVSDAFTQGMNTSEEKASLDSLPDDLVLSPLEQARAAIADNASTQNFSALKEEAIVDTDNVKLDTNETATNYSQTEDLEENSVDDADKVPVATTLTDDEVPNKPGAILMHAREILGLSLREVAHKLNLRINSVADIEHDRLNQETAVQFVSGHIAAYAKLVNIDPVFLVNLYKECVRTSTLERAIAQKEQEKLQARNPKKEVLSDPKNVPSKSNKSKIALAIIGVIGIVAASVGITVAVMSSSDNQSSGALVIEDTVEGSQDNAGNLVLDTENSKLKTQIVEEEPLVAVDVNTQLAQEQAKELDTNEIISSRNKSHNDVDVDDSSMALQVKGKAADKIEANKPALEAQDVAPIAPVENSLQSVSLNSTADSNKNAKKANDAQLKNTTAIAQNTKTQAQATQNTPAKVEVKSEPKEETAVNVALVANPRDISSSVRLQGKRDPLSGLNTATIRVRGDVALKVTGNGKLLKQGNFKAGQSVTVSGIPPLRVSVSDSSKISVSYQGTTLAVPRSSQVSFALPQR